MRRPVRAFTAFAIAYTGLRDFVPLYAVYALLFQAEGLSASAISSLFLVWSVTSFLAEVPSGAWADLVSRRLLLSAGSLLTAMAFTLWLLIPTAAGFAAGFILWGIGGALVSGTWESLVYDTLAERGATSSYAWIIGGGESASWLAAVASAAMTAPLLVAGGYGLVGWISVSVAVLHAGLALLLPDPPRTGVDPDDPEADRPPGEDAGAGAVIRGYVSTLSAGLREATRHPPVRRVVLGLSLLTGLLAFDEYLPLVAAGTGVATEAVPLLMTLTFLTQAVAAALAGPASRLHVRWPPRLLALGATLVGVGALVRHPVGFAAIAVGYALANCVMIVADARLQDAIAGRARATVTSTVGLGSELVAVALFTAYAGGSAFLPIALLVALNGLLLLGLMPLLRRWLS